MPAYFYWGEDDFAIAQAVKQLQTKILDPDWLEFNYHQLTGDRSETIIEGLTQVMTPVFGMGDRLVWLSDTNICQQCSQDTLQELERTLTTIPLNSHLLLTTNKKPDGRLKSTKLINKHAEVKDFSLIPPWKPELIARKVRLTAQEIGVKLTPKAVELLVESVGNNTRRLYNELEKLSLYNSAASNSPIDETAVAALVVCYTQNSLQLAAAIRDGQTAQALQLVTELINRNEPALKIVATLVGQFRTWTIVKLMQEAGEKDEKAIATVAEVKNPKRIYFIRKEVDGVATRKLLASLQLLLDLEYSLKRGGEPLTTLQTKAIELSYLFQL